MTREILIAKCYAAVNRDGRISLETVASSRMKSIHRAVQILLPHVGQDWNDLRRAGWRCRKVEIAWDVVR